MSDYNGLCAAGEWIRTIIFSSIHFSQLIAAGFDGREETLVSIRLTQDV